VPTTVVNIKSGAPYDVYIGRPSRWGNPFMIGRNGTRRNVLDAYQVWLSERPDLIAALGELRGRILGCYCKPLPCHGDLLAKLADAVGGAW